MLPLGHFRDQAVGFRNHQGCNPGAEFRLDFGSGHVSILHGVVKRGGGKQFFGIAVPYTQAQIDFEGIGFTHKDTNMSLEMNGNGVVFKPSDRLWDAMEKDGRYSLVGGVADPNSDSSGRGYSWGFFTIKNISFRLPAAYIRRISTAEAREAKWDLADLIV